jgi:hypothetical protein
VPLDLGHTKRLIRLQGVADELLGAARRADTTAEETAVEEHLDAVMSEVVEVLAETDAEMAEEFRQTVVAGTRGAGSVGPRAATLVGWLKGAVYAESLEHRIEAEAQAYAQARVEQEQPLGFRAVEPRSDDDPSQSV